MDRYLQAVTPGLIFQILTAACAVFLVVDKWRRGREMKEADFEAKLLKAEELRVIREGVVNGTLARLSDDIKVLHQKASDFGTEQQRRVSAMNLQLVELKMRQEEMKTRQDEMYDIVNSRRSSREK